MDHAGSVDIKIFTKFPENSKFLINLGYVYIQITGKEPEVAFENTGFEPWLVWYFQLLHSESNPLPP